MLELSNIDCFQVAQQEAQRAAFVVDRAIQEKQQKIVQVCTYIVCFNSLPPPDHLIVRKTSEKAVEKRRSGLGSNNKNTLKNYLNSCQIFRLLANISDCFHIKTFNKTFLDFK